MTLQTHDPPRSPEIDLNVLAGRATEDVKLAHRVVAMLQRDIIAAGLADGYSMGTAAEIRTRYNVGRWALREAVGILELRGIARLKSGPGGGLIVTAPDFTDLVNLTLLYLYASHSGPREINEVRRAVVTAVVKKLLDRAPQSGAPPVECVIDPATNLPLALALQTRNEAFELAAQFVEAVKAACVPPQTAPGDWMDRGRSLWLAICRGERDAAFSQLDDYLAIEERWMVDAWMGLPEISKPQSGAGRLAYRLALEILKHVVEHPDQAGDLFGSESEIGRRFDATAEIVRQSIRLIEDLGIVSPRRGRYGGVVLRPPDASSIAALIPHLLLQKRVSVAKCCDAAQYLNDEIARLAAERIRDTGKSPIRPYAPDEVSHRNLQFMNRQIQTYACNPLLSSIERGMAFYSYTIDPPVFASNPPLEPIIAFSKRVLEAVEDGDTEGASAAVRERFEFMSQRFVEPASEPD